MHPYPHCRRAMPLWLLFYYTRQRMNNGGIHQQTMHNPKSRRGILIRDLRSAMFRRRLLYPSRKQNCLVCFWILAVSEGDTLFIFMFALGNSHTASVRWFDQNDYKNLFSSDVAGSNFRTILKRLEALLVLDSREINGKITGRFGARSCRHITVSVARNSTSQSSRTGLLQEENGGSLLESRDSVTTPNSFSPVFFYFFLRLTCGPKANKLQLRHATIPQLIHSAKLPTQFDVLL